MQIKIFNQTQKEEANKFLAEKTVISVSYENFNIIVIYKDPPDLTQTIAKKIRDEEAEALVGLKEAEMQLQYLEAIAKQSEEDAKIVEGSIKGTKQNIKNFKVKLEVIELWKKE